MNKTRYFVIQLNAVMLLLGYWFFHAIVTLVIGESSRVMSIVFDGIQLIMSLYVIAVCHRDFVIEEKGTGLVFFSILLVLYSLRMFIDMIGGPFVGKLPTEVFLNDILLTVVGTFIPVWSFIISRKYIDVDTVVKFIFWVGLIIILAVRLNAQNIGNIDVYEEERMSGGQGLGSLVLVKVGAFVVMAAIHLLLNPLSKRKYLKIFYVLGLMMGVWIALASGARGGVVGLVIAVGTYFVFLSRHTVFLIVIAVIAVILVIVNIVPILTWLSDFFPVFGRRMLATVIENDQSDRQELRRQAIEITLNHPFFGYSYRMLPTPTGFRTHNGILEVSIALGIPVTILFIYFVYIKGVFLSLKNMINKSLIFPTTAAIFALSSSMSSSSISNGAFDFSVCFLFIACYYYLKQSTALRNVQ